MADNASIARPYAKAVFELAQESNAFDAWADALAKLSGVSQDADFAKLVSDPKVSSSQLNELLESLVGESMPSGGNNFIRLVVDNDRALALSEIQSQFTALVAKAKASVNAEVKTAMALNDEQKAALVGALEQRLGLKVNLQETVDANLVGGAVIKAGDLVIDGSAKGRIEKLTSALMR